MGYGISDIGEAGIYEDALFNPCPLSLLTRIKIKKCHERIEELGMAITKSLWLLEEQFDGNGEKLR